MTEMVSGVAMGLVTDSATNQVLLFLQMSFYLWMFVLIVFVNDYEENNF